MEKSRVTEFERRRIIILPRIFKVDIQGLTQGYLKLQLFIYYICFRKSVTARILLYITYFPHNI